MFIDSIKDYMKDLYFQRTQLLYKNGVEEKKIVPFNNKFYGKLENIYIDTIPVSIHIKYLKPNTKEAKRFDRSLYLFISLQNVVLVRANCKDLNYKYGRESFRNAWVEDDKYVYDPTLLVRVDKKLYYKMFMPTKIDRLTKKEYLENEFNSAYYNNIINTKIEDFMPNGSKRNDFVNTVPNLIELAQVEENKGLLADLKNYIKKVDNSKTISGSNTKEYKKVLMSKNIV